MEKELQKIEELNELIKTSSVERVKIDFTINDIEDVKKISKQQNEHLFTPCDWLPVFWTVILFDKVEVTFKSKELTQRKDVWI